MTSLSWLRAPLAELCGLKLFTPVPELEGVYALSEKDEADTMIGYRHWQPDLDVGQAIRCLESPKAGMGMQHEFICVYSQTATTNHWECHLQLSLREAQVLEALK